MTNSTNLIARCCARLCPKRCGSSSALSFRTAPDSQTGANRRPERWLVYISGLLFIAVGVAIIFVVLYYEHPADIIHPASSAYSTTSSVKHGLQPRPPSNPVPGESLIPDTRTSETDNGETQPTGVGPAKAPISETVQPSMPASEPTSRPPDEHTPVIILDLFKHIGVAFVVIGFISIGLEFPHWREYFQHRLADVVVEHLPRQIKRSADPGSATKNVEKAIPWSGYRTQR